MFDKRTLILALGAALLLAALPAAAQDGVSIAVVDLERVVGQSKSGQALQQKLEAFRQQVQTEGEGLAQKARDLRQRVAEGANTLAEEKLAELQKEYEDATIAIRRFQDDKEREGQKMQGEGLREIEKQLKPVFDKVQADGGYDLILNNVPGVVVMANERVDITAQVIEAFNAAHGG